MTKAEMYREAKRLEKLQGNDAPIERFDAFWETLNKAYANGEITAAEFNEMGLIAFYDFDIKG